MAVTIPVRPVASERAPIAPKSIHDALAAGDLDGTKVLVVDDDIRNSFALTALLERARAEVVVVESGAEAIASLEKEPNVDIVLMDVMMPVMDGNETTRAIRAVEALKSLPIIAVTGKVVPGERERCLDAGANDFVSKPVDAEDLLSVMRSWLRTPDLATRPSGQS